MGGFAKNDVNKMVTLKDIAERAGVSVITVSRVLNDTHPNKVSEKTRSRVRRIADELGYHPNIPARALRGHRTYQFGLVVPTVDYSFVPQIIQGLQEAAIEMHYSCLLYVTNWDPDLELQIFKTLMAKTVDGIVWIPEPQRDEEVDKLVKDQKVIQLQHKEIPDVPAILVDQEEGGYQATRHLIALGHRRIGNLTHVDRHGKQRLDGYLRALQQADITPSEEMIQRVAPTWDEAHQGAHALLDRREPPTAIVCYSDLVAWAALRAAQERGIVVPDELSLIGFDDVAFIQHLEIPMTTVAQPKHELGRLAMSFLSDLIDGKEVNDHVLTPSLIIRSSTARV